MTPLQEAAEPVEVCPLCGEEIQAGEERDRDHVFGKAFGASTRVPTHKSCNGRFGHGAEAALHGADTYFNFARSAHGLAQRLIPGSAEDGTPVQVDLGQGAVWPAQAVSRPTKRGDRVELRAAGTDAQLRAALKSWRKGYGDQIPRLEDIPRIPTAQTPEMVKMITAWDVRDAEAFGVKAALGAGTRAYGASFATGPLARALRAWRDAPFDNPLDPGFSDSRRPRRLLEALSDIDEFYGERVSQMAAAGLAVSPLPSLVPPAEGLTYQVVFLPLGRAGGAARTAVFVHVLSIPAMPWGIVLAAPLPNEQDDLPVLLREHDHQFAVVDFTEHILAAVNGCAQRSEDL